MRTQIPIIKINKINLDQSRNPLRVVESGQGSSCSAHHHRRIVVLLVIVNEHDFTGLSRVIHGFAERTREQFRYFAQGLQLCDIMVTLIARRSRLL